MDELRKSKKGLRFETEAILKEILYLYFNKYELIKNNMILSESHIL